MRVKESSKRSRSGRLSQREIVSYAMSRLGEKGIGFNREQTLGALGSIAGESGRNLDPRAYNPKDPNGGSYGIGQWHSERRTNLERFAKNSKYGLNDVRTQIDFVAHELKTTHKHVKDAMLGATTRHKAADIWTKKYEVPHKNYEHLPRRRANADMFARIAEAPRPGSPQAAIDSATATDAMAYANDESLTGAQLSSYTGPAETKKKGAFESMFGGISDALGGLSTALDGGKVQAQERLDGAMSESEAAAANAKADAGYWGQPNMGAQIGAFAGGYFGGPVGAVIGGLAGQGLGRVLTGGTALEREKRANEEMTGGILGGIGRALDQTVGGVLGALGGVGGPTFESGSGSSSTESRSGSYSSGAAWDRGGWNDGTSTSPSNSRSYGSKGGAGSGQGHVRGESSHQ